MIILCDCGEAVPVKDGKAVCPCGAVITVDAKMPKPKPEPDYNIWIGAGFVVLVVVCLWLVTMLENWGLTLAF